MLINIITVKVKYEQDVVLARQRARTIASLLGFDTNDQTRISTAVSEIARNVYKYADGGDISFGIDGDSKPQVFIIIAQDNGKGIENIDEILEGNYKSNTGMGLGILGAKKLMDYFHIETKLGSGTKVVMGKVIPLETPFFDNLQVQQIINELLREIPKDPLEEIRQQNQELIKAYEELSKKQEELIKANKDLEERNKVILALNRELEEKNAQLSLLNKTRAQFISNLTHEFRTPINSILALSRILLDRIDGPLTSEQEKQVSFIRKAADDISNLVNDFLDLAKLEAGKITLNIGTVNLSELFSTLRGMMTPLIKSSDVKLIFDIDKDIIIVSDEGKITQILRNLISNAIKFTERGEIRVSAKSNDEKNCVEISVKDTGIGIAKEHQKIIFDEFTQVESPLQRKFKGTGLGLPLSKKLAELLKGKLEVESEVGKGSTFTLILPLAYVDEETGTKKADKIKLPVLIVDDDEVTVKIYETFLKGSGYEAIWAKDLKKAREILKNVTPTAIILDILLNHEDSGWDLLIELKKDERLKDIPVIVATVLEDKEKAFSLDADEFITKPVDKSWLLRTIEKFSQKKEAGKILIIDDEEVSRYLLKSVLSETKFTLLEAENGMIGLEVALKERPDIIFLDLMMPIMNGFETLQKLKENKVTKDIPVIIVSSKVLSQEEKVLLNSATKAIIPKQCTSKDAILNKLREVIKLK